MTGECFSMNELTSRQRQAIETKQKIRQTSRLTAKQLEKLRRELGVTYVPEE